MRTPVTPWRKFPWFRLCFLPTTHLNSCARNVGRSLHAKLRISEALYQLGLPTYLRFLFLHVLTWLRTSKKRTEEFSCLSVFSDLSHHWWWNGKPRCLVSPRVSRRSDEPEDEPLYWVAHRLRVLNHQITLLVSYILHFVYNFVIYNIK